MKKVMNNPVWTLLALTALLAACSPRISTSVKTVHPALSPDKEVYVIGLNDPYPENYEKLGTVLVGDKGFTGTARCTYNEVVRLAREEARKNGANALKITYYIPPAMFGSTCHQIRADLLKTENITEGMRRDSGTTPAPQVFISKKKYPRFQFSGSAGFSYLISNVKTDNEVLKDHFAELKTGYYAAADASYGFRNGLGVGLRYSMFKTENTFSNIVYTLPGGTTIPGSISDDITIHTVTPTFVSSFITDDQKFLWVSTLGIGYTYMQNHAVGLKPAEITSDNVAFVFQWDFAYKIGNDLYLNALIGLDATTFQTFRVKDDQGTTSYTSSDPEGWSHLNLGLGLRYVIPRR